MSEHPIEGLMLTAMNSIEDMIDVNTIIGEPIETSNGIVIIPISKVSFGFAAGGSEFKGETIDEYKRKDKDESVQYRLPFGGGSGAGVSINPVSFLIVQNDKVKLLPINHSSCIDKILDYVPELFDKIENITESKKDKADNDFSNSETNNKSKDKKKANINKVAKTTEDTKLKADKKDYEEKFEDLFEEEYEYDDDE